MLIYVTRKNTGELSDLIEAATITGELQEHDLDNCYVCSILTFSHIDVDTVSLHDEIELRIDLLSAADKLLVIGEADEAMEAEIAFAKNVGMEVSFLGENG